MPRKSRNTKQKELINKEIRKIKDFFTAEDLYNIVKKKYPVVGLATIYRFMKDLRKNKKIHAYICNNKLLYSKDNKSHCHFVCEETGKVVHFDVDSLDFLKNKIPGSISSFQIEVKGKCEECLKR
jgi:Fur family ferric uptake transcriptional regulator|tara:strand:- start:109 stop:483 length:375 start_codon:yes stop_codon:yes gene_type:complete